MEILAELPSPSPLGSDRKAPWVPGGLGHHPLSEPSTNQDEVGVKALSAYWESTPFWGGHNSSHTTGYTVKVPDFPFKWSAEVDGFDAAVRTNQFTPAVAEVVPSTDDVAAVITPVITCGAIMPVVPVAELMVPAPFELLEAHHSKWPNGHPKAVVYKPLKVEALRAYYVSQEEPIEAMELMPAMEAVEVEFVAQAVSIEARRPKSRAAQKAVVFKSRKIEILKRPVSFHNIELVEPVKRIEPLSVAQVPPKVRCVSVAQAMPTVAPKQKLLSIGMISM
jgi:hypothetical protein